MSHPFADLEAALKAPAATGIFLVEVDPRGRGAAYGLRPGDIIACVDGEPMETLHDLIMALNSDMPGVDSGNIANTRTLEIIGPTAARREITVPAGRLGVFGYGVTEGQLAWADIADTAYTPDFSALAEGGEIWMRTMFGTERAGFERFKFGRAGQFLTVDHLTCFGGENDGHQWVYRTHVCSTHRLDRELGVTMVRVESGLPDEPDYFTSAFTIGDESAGSNGHWHGVLRDHAGTEREISEPIVTPRAINTYSIPLLALTMPLKKGTVLTVAELRDSTAVTRGRSRLECVANRKVDVDGRKVEAFAFAWVHYGDAADNEIFWVTPERELVRIDWGEDYAGCSCERVSRERVAAGLPGFIAVE